MTQPPTGVPYQNCSLQAQFSPHAIATKDMYDWECAYLHLRNAIRANNPHHPILSIHYKTSRGYWACGFTPQESIDLLLERCSLA